MGWCGTQLKPTAVRPLGLRSEPPLWLPRGVRTRGTIALYA